MKNDDLRAAAPPEVLRWWNSSGEGRAHAVYCLNRRCRWVEVSQRTIHRDYCPECGAMVYREPYPRLSDV